MKTAVRICVSLLEQRRHDVIACGVGEDFCMEKLLESMLKADRNPCDIHLPSRNDGGDTECYDMSYVYTYLDAPNVREVLEVDSKRVGAWQEYNSNASASGVVHAPV
ncbi:putative carboxypeptidase [Phytophthora infestans]|uniref:Putative carboxypeptidase n=1 Tax=Phytophthora infestans TaxID=4787 RepID=A0A833TIU7_PHYIN|nr:putative carboxypeptidase [Phytophthora infestans]KAF4139247.1 putative Carboxypeptidase [Phytophthora infestans]